MLDVDLRELAARAELWEDEPGDGVRAFARFSEMRADLRGEYGSHESLYPCFGVSGVRTLPGGEGVEQDIVAMVVVAVAGQLCAACKRKQRREFDTTARCQDCLGREDR